MPQKFQKSWGRGVGHGLENNQIKAAFFLGASLSVHLYIHVSPVYIWTFTSVSSSCTCFPVNLSICSSILPPSWGNTIISLISHKKSQWDNCVILTSLTCSQSLVMVASPADTWECQVTVGRGLWDKWDHQVCNLRCALRKSFENLHNVSWEQLLLNDLSFCPPMFFILLEVWVIIIY